MESPWFDYAVLCRLFRLTTTIPACNADVECSCVGLRVSVRCVSLLHTPIPKVSLEGLGDVE